MDGDKELAPTWSNYRKLPQDYKSKAISKSKTGKTRTHKFKPFKKTVFQIASKFFLMNSIERKDSIETKILAKIKQFLESSRTYLTAFPFRNNGMLSAIEERCKEELVVYMSIVMKAFLASEPNKKTNHQPKVEVANQFEAEEATDPEPSGPISLLEQTDTETKEPKSYDQEHKDPTSLLQINPYTDFNKYPQTDNTTYAMKNQEKTRAETKQEETSAEKVIQDNISLEWLGDPTYENSGPQTKEEEAEKEEKLFVARLSGNLP